MGGDIEHLDKRDKREDKDKKDKDKKERKRDRSRSRSRSRDKKRDKSKERRDKRDKGKESSNGEKEKEKDRRRTEDRTKDKERSRRDRSKERSDEKKDKKSDKDKDKKEKHDDKKDRKDKTKDKDKHKNDIDSLFGEKFSVVQQVVVAPPPPPTPTSPPPTLPIIGDSIFSEFTPIPIPENCISIEDPDGMVHYVKATEEEYFDASLGKQLTYDDTVELYVGGRRVGIPPTAQEHYTNCPSNEEIEKINANIAADGGLVGGPNGTICLASENIPSTAMALAVVGANSAANNPTVGGVMTPEQIRTARENRRMHITGFPRFTPEPYVRQVIEERFIVYRREIIAKNSNMSVDDLPEGSECNVDRIVELFLDSQKEKPFAFIEINTDDMVDMFISPANMNERPVNIPLTDGSNASLFFGRPRDFKKMAAVDPTRIIIQGIPPTFDAEKMKNLVAKFAEISIPEPKQPKSEETTSAGEDTAEGDDNAPNVEEVKNDENENKKTSSGEGDEEDTDCPYVKMDFAMRDGVAFANFEDEATAQKVIRGLNGKALARRLMSAQPLTEVMRAYCISNLGFKIPNKEIPEQLDESKKEDESVFMELLKLSTSLPQLMLKLGSYYPHLAPLMGTLVPVLPTRILVLLNMVDDTDLDTDAAYDTLCQNVAREVEQYGRVKNLIIPRLEPPPPPLFVRKQIEKPPAHLMSSSSTAAGATDDIGFVAPLPGGATISVPTEKTPEELEYEAAVKEQDELEAAYEKAKREYPQKRLEWERTKDDEIYGRIGRIYVEYETAAEALNAQQNIAGKLYCNRTVVTTFLFEDILYPPAEEEQPQQLAAEETTSPSAAQGQRLEQESIVDATASHMADSDESLDAPTPEASVEEDHPKPLALVEAEVDDLD